MAYRFSTAPLLAAMLVAAVFLLTAPAAAEETPYAPLPDPRELHTPPAPPEPETAYNPAGTESSLPAGLISFRRDEKGHRGFLLGMQAAALATSEEPINVAPLSAETPEEQLDVLRRRGVSVFLLDAPDAVKAREFLEKTQPLALQTVLVSARVPDWRTPPIVVSSPAQLAERAGEAAIRHTGNEEVVVAYVLPPSGETTHGGVISADIEKLFLQGFRGAAPLVELLELDPADEERELDTPAAVCLLTESVTEEWMEALRERFPDTFLIGTGETPAIAEAAEEGLLDARVRPDYGRLYDAAMREARQRSEFPAVVAPTIDRLPPPDDTPDDTPTE